VLNKLKMKVKTFLKTFLLIFQILFISTSIVVENNQDLSATLNLFANEIAEIKNKVENKFVDEIAELKHNVETNFAKIQSKVMSKRYENFPKYTILTVGSEEIFNYFTIRYF